MSTAIKVGSLEVSRQNASGNQRYGWLGFTPRWIQFLNDPKWLMFFMSTGAIAYHIANGGVFPSVVSTLEKRYHLSNQEIGLISSSMDIVTIILFLFVSYYAEWGHKGRFISIGILLNGIAALIFAAPQFFSGSSLAHNIGSQGATMDAVPVCTDKSADNDPDCTSHNIAEWSRTPFRIFVVSKLLQAIGESTSPLGISYIDENVSQKASPLYTSGLFIVGMIGTVIGYVVAAVSLKHHTDFYRTDTSEIRPGDPNWYGAWWIGFVITGVMLLLLVFPMLGFPRDLSSKRESREKDVDESHRSSTKKQFGNSLSDFPNAVFMLLRNPVFALVALRNGIQLQFIVGLSIFMTVYMQQAQRISSGYAALAMVCLWVVPSLIGNAVGGCIINLFQLPVRKVILVTIFASSGCTMLFYLSLPHCPTMGVAGVNRHFDGSHTMNGERMSMVAHCNANCQCSLSMPHPICMPKYDMVYYSPCHAGCHYFDSNKDRSTAATRCACANSNSSMPSWYSEGGLHSGRCPLPEKCYPKRTAFVIFLAISTFVGGVGATPTMQAILRSVPFSQRTLAMGIHSFLIKVLVIPGPLIFGHFMDKSCLLWTEKCSKRGSCFLYNIEQMTSFIVAYSIIVALIGTGMLVGAVLLYQPPNDDPMYMRYRKRKHKIVYTTVILIIAVCCIKLVE